MTTEEVYAMVMELKRQLSEEKVEASKERLRHTYAFVSHFTVAMMALGIGLAIGSCHYVIK